MSADDRRPINPVGPGPRGRLIAAAMAVVLGLAGLGMIGFAAAHQDHAPQPPVAATDQPRPAPSAGLSASPEPSPTPSRVESLPASTPTRIRIYAINLDSPVNTVGLNRDHTMEVPHEGPLYDQPAWYRYSPTPGETGPSVIVGHVDSARNGPSAFYKLGALAPGQHIEVTRADHTTAHFSVDSVQSYPKNSFPQLAVYGATTYPDLRLITCGGSFDHTTEQYRNNTVVFAHLTTTTTTTTR